MNWDPLRWRKLRVKWIWRGQNEAINTLSMVSLRCMLDTQGGGIYGFGVQKRDVNYREIFEYHQHRGI